MKYIIEFKKTGAICYTSHLDIMKVFKRSFKKSEVPLQYSQGFNPHPKMGFAQPLSLGYEGLQEYIEFETDDVKCSKSGNEILEDLKKVMPEGLELLSVQEASWLKKTLAAETLAAEYTVRIPVDESSASILKRSSSELWHEYMQQEKIITSKKQKKKKDLIQVDIKPKIRELIFFVCPDELRLEMFLDSGSESNLSPELLITTVLQFFDIKTDRSRIEVVRKKIHFKNRLKQKILE